MRKITAHLKDTPENVKGETRAHVIGLLMLRRGMRTFGDLARRLGISNGYLGDIIYGRRRTPAAQAAIARELGVKPTDLFGTDTHPSLKKEPA